MTKFSTNFGLDFDPAGKQYRLLYVVIDDLDHNQEIVIGIRYCRLLYIIIANNQ